MDDRKIPLPEWLPWATTAVLAALVACVGELWIVEKTRSQILRDDSALAAAELKAVSNQLETERIIGQRLLSGVQASFGVALLGPRNGTPNGSLAAFGAVVWNPRTKRGLVSFHGVPRMAPDGDFQLWIDDSVLTSMSYPRSCDVFPPPQGNGPVRIPVAIDSAFSGARFYLTYGKKGGAQTIQEAIASGSIVLASPTP